MEYVEIVTTSVVYHAFADEKRNHNHSIYYVHRKNTCITCYAYANGHEKKGRV